MRLYLSASEAQYEHNEELGRPPIALDQPASVTLDVPGSWVQQTYETLRVAEDGDHLLVFNEGWWVPLVDYPVTEAALLDGTTLDPRTVEISGMKFTDVTIAA
jgi:hypothetical protein